MAQYSSLVVSRPSGMRPPQPHRSRQAWRLGPCDHRGRTKPIRLGNTRKLQIRRDHNTKLDGFAILGLDFVSSEAAQGDPTVWLAPSRDTTHVHACNQCSLTRDRGPLQARVRGWKWGKSPKTPSSVPENCATALETRVDTSLCFSLPLRAEVPRLRSKSFPRFPDT
jgi:hypothetical protein